MVQRVDFEGTVNEFPDDFTPAEISAALSGATAHAPAPPIAGAGPGGSDLNYYDPGYPAAGVTLPVGPQPLPDEPIAPGVPLSPRALQVGTQGVGRGVADLVGLPGDASVGIANLALKGADAVTGGDVPYRFPPSPVGSQALSDVGSRIMRALGIGPIEPTDMSAPERYGYTADRIGAQALAGGAGLARAAGVRAAEMAAQPTRLMPRIGDALLRPYMNAPGKTLAGDTAAGVGSGVALEGSHDIIPKAYQGPLTDAAAMLVGGPVGATVAMIGRAPMAAIDAVRSLRTDPNIPFEAGTLKPTSRGTANAAARIAQGLTSGAPSTVAETIRNRITEAAAHDEPAPTAGTASGDIGFMAGENVARSRNAVPFMERDQEALDAAQGNVTGLRNEAADPRAAQAAVENMVATQRQAAQTETDASRAALDAQRADNARRLADVEAKRVAALSTADQTLAQGKQDLAAAQDAERAVGGTVQGKLGAEGAASERVASAVDAAKQADEAQKAGLYDSATEAAKAVPVDAQALADHAAAVRATISPLAQSDGRLNSVLSDLERLSTKDEPPVSTGVLDASGNPITKPAPQKEGITAADLIAMRPRLSAARDAAVKLRRGDVIQRLDQINSGIADKLDVLAQSGNPAALQWQKAEENFKGNFAPKYREGVGGQMDKAERAGSPTPPTAVAGKFLRPGRGGKEAAADLQRILAGSANEADGMQAARDYVSADMARVVGADGKINPNRLRVWIANRQGMFDQVPGLGDEAKQTLRDVISGRQATTNLQRNLETTAAERRGTAVSTKREIADIRSNAALTEAQKAEQVAAAERRQAQTEADIRSSATSLLLDSDPTVAVKRVFGASDPEKAMGEIVAELKGDQGASEGWKRAVVDDLIERVTNSNTALTTGSDGPVSAAKLVNMFNKNRKVYAKVFTPEEMHAVTRAQRILEPLGNKVRRATTGSATAENQESWRLLEAGILGATGNAVKTGMVMKRIRTVIGLLPNSQEKVRHLLDRMYLDPELAQHLLTRPVQEIKGPVWNAKLNRLLAYGQAARDEATPAEPVADQQESHSAMTSAFQAAQDAHAASAAKRGVPFTPADIAPSDHSNASKIAPLWGAQKGSLK